MGGIDEAALDRLSLVTQMTKHVRVRASGGRTTASEIGQFSPIFVWLLRVICYELYYFHLSYLCCMYVQNDISVLYFCLFLIYIYIYIYFVWQCITSSMQDFYLDLVEDDRRITPRDYLELALRPVQGSGKDMAAKNEVISGFSCSYSYKIAAGIFSLFDWNDCYEKSFYFLTFLSTLPVYQGAELTFLLMWFFFTYQTKIAEGIYENNYALVFANSW